MSGKRNGKESPQAETEIAQVALDQIHTDEDAFQWRYGFNIEDSTRHVEELKRALKDRQRPLAPILVLPQASGFVVIDGHHRLEAYKEASWGHPVPVEIFHGTPQEAELEALKRNIEDKLPMTQQDKLEAAWRLVLAGTFSKSKINELTTVSNGTIGNMRKALEHHGKEALADLAWFEVKRMAWKQDDDFDYDEYALKRATKLAKEFTHKSSVHLADNPDILALALELISDRIPRALVERWPEIAQEVAEEHSSRPPI